MNRLVALTIAMDETFTLKERIESIVSPFILSTLIHLPVILIIVNLGILFLHYVTLYAILGSLALGSWILVWRLLYAKSLRKKTTGSTIPLEKVALSHALALFIIVFAVTLYALNETLIQYF